MKKNSKAKPKVLCLHGYRQNAAIFRQKSAALRKALKNRVEFDYISAPLVPSLNFDDEKQPENGEEQSRAWWFSRAENTFSSREETEIAEGFEESSRLVREYLGEKGPFAGLLGFSQGASLVHLLLASHFPELSSIRFVVLFSAFKSLSTLHRPLNGVKLRISSFHVYGLSDEIVLHKRSEELARECFDSAVIVTHPGKHCIPPLKEFRDRLIPFFEDNF